MLLLLYLILYSSFGTHDAADLFYKVATPNGDRRITFKDTTTHNENYELAFNFVKSHSLQFGVGCTSMDCLAEFIAKEMDQVCRFYKLAANNDLPSSIVADNIGTDGGMHILEMSGTESNSNSMYSGLMFLLDKSDSFVGAQLLATSSYESQTLDLLLSCVTPGSIVIDVGANIGAFSIPLLRKIGASGMVYAFEPQKHLSHLLAANIALNIAAGVFPHSIEISTDVVSDMDGLISSVPNLTYNGSPNSRNYAEQSFSDNFFQSPEVGLNSEKNVLKTTTLDSIWFNNQHVDGLNEAALKKECPHVIKVDVEKMESKVLVGASKLISVCKPVLIVEGWDDESRLSAIETCRLNQYISIWDQKFADAYFRNSDGSSTIQQVNVHNVLCLPSYIDPFHKGQQIQIPPRILTNDFQSKLRRDQLLDYMNREINNGRLKLVNQAATLME